LTAPQQALTTFRRHPQPDVPHPDDHHRSVESEGLSRDGSTQASGASATGELLEDHGSGAIVLLAEEATRAAQGGELGASAGGPDRRSVRPWPRPYLRPGGPRGRGMALLASASDADW